MKERIVVVPGSFNPVTKAHIKMAETAAKAICAKKIIFVPAADKYVAAKGCKVIDGLERVKLIKQTAPTIITDIKVDVMTEEVTGFVDGLTYNTVNYIKNHNFADIFVCFGADVVPTLPSWEKGEEMIKENDFIIIKRDNNEIDFPDELHRYRENFMFIPSVIPAGISSTKVREAAAKGDFETIEEISGKAVRRYMEHMANKEDK